MEFRVIWEIDIDAENPREAAHGAREIQLRPDMPATVFDVWEHAAGKMYRIDVAGETERLSRAELAEIRARLRLLQCSSGIAASTLPIAMVMLVFLDKGRDEKEEIANQCRKSF
jgi:hypothetical protein